MAAAVVAAGMAAGMAAVVGWSRKFAGGRLATIRGKGRARLGVGQG